MSPGRAEASWLGDVALAGVSAGALAVVLVLVFSERDVAAQPPDRREPIGEVARRNNEVRRRMDRTLVWNGLDNGTPIYENDAVYVGPDSAATIRLSDGSQIDIDETSLVVISQNRPDGTQTAVIAVDILRGGVSGRAAERLDLRAGGASTRLDKGTAVAMQVRSDKSTRVAVRSGKASVETAAGAAVVSQGERQTVDAAGHVGEVLKAAVQLHAPEDGARVYINRASRVVQFGWADVEGRGQYRFEVGSDAGFGDVVVDMRVKRPTISVASLAAGVYFWRVSRGERVSEERKLVLIDDWPPVPYRPRSEAVVDLSERPSLSIAWGAVPNVRHYRIELARGRSFKTPLYALRTDRPSHILRADEVKLEEGRHCFRVRADEPERRTSPWSTVMCFRIVVKPVLRAPEVYDPTREDLGSGGESGQRGSLRVPSPARHTLRQSPVRGAGLNGRVETGSGGGAVGSR